MGGEGLVFIVLTSLVIFYKSPQLQISLKSLQGLHDFLKDAIHTWFAFKIKGVTRSTSLD
jgi:hypothetical protein